MAPRCAKLSPGKTEQTLVRVGMNQSEPTSSQPTRMPIMRCCLALVRFGLAWALWLFRCPRAIPVVLRRARVVGGASGTIGLWQALVYKALGRQRDLPPDRWYRATRPTARTLQRMRDCNWISPPRFVVAVDLEEVGQTQFIELLDSLDRQVYEHWRLVAFVRPANRESVRQCLAARPRPIDRISLVSMEGATTKLEALRDAISNCDAACLLDGDTTLEPAALYRLAEAFRDTLVDVAYGDAVRIDAATGEPIEILARPAFSYQYLLATRYIDGCVAVRSSVLTAALNDALLSTELSEGFDLLLRAIEKSDRVAHVASVLTRQSGGNSADLVPSAAENRAVRSHLARLGKGTLRTTSSASVVRDVAWDVVPTGRVGIVIATKNAEPLLRQCVESVRRTVRSDKADLIIVDHASDEASSMAYLRSLAGHHQVVRQDRPFNFSRLMNEGVAAASGRTYTHWLFLNNDIEAREPGWLDHMLGLAARSDVGVVGATLLYPNRHVQHAGVIVGLRGLAGHYGLGLPAYDAADRRESGYQRALVASREVSAVTGACLLIRRDLFEQLGGFDEELAVGYGDVDLCLRARSAGYQVLMDGEAVLTHHESYTRGKTAWDPHPDDTRRFFARYADLIATGDPYYSPHLSCVLTQYQLEAPRRETLTVPIRRMSVCLPRDRRSIPLDHSTGTRHRPAA